MDWTNLYQPVMELISLQMNYSILDMTLASKMSSPCSMVHTESKIEECPEKISSTWSNSGYSLQNGNLDQKSRSWVKNPQRAVWTSFTNLDQSKNKITCNEQVCFFKLNILPRYTHTACSHTSKIFKIKIWYTSYHMLYTTF